MSASVKLRRSTLLWLRDFVFLSAAELLWGRVFPRLPIFFVTPCLSAWLRLEYARLAALPVWVTLLMSASLVYCGAAISRVSAGLLTSALESACPPRQPCLVFLRDFSLGSKRTCFSLSASVTHVASTASAD